MPHACSGDTPEEKLEEYAFSMGKERARMALAMDLLTDAMIALGQNKVYTHSVTGKQVRDREIEQAIARLDHDKKLVAMQLRDLDEQRQPPRS
jgi:hypothetical protein